MKPGLLLEYPILAYHKVFHKLQMNHEYLAPFWETGSHFREAGSDPFLEFLCLGLPVPDVPVVPLVTYTCYALLYLGFLYPIHLGSVCVNWVGWGGGARSLSNGRRGNSALLRGGGPWLTTPLPVGCVR